MEAQRLSQLIGLIYDSAQNLELWPLLLKGLTEALHPQDTSDSAYPQLESIDKLGDYVSHWYDRQSDELLPQHHADQFIHFSGKEHELIQMVLPHLVKALKLNRSLLDISVENQAFASVLEHLPIGMVITDKNGRVYAKNRRFDEQLGNEGLLRLRAGHLGIVRPEDERLLNTMIQEVADGSSDTAHSQALRLQGSKPVSLMLLPLVSAECFSVTPKVIIFVASVSTHVEIEPRSLQSIYGLSKAESRLTIALVNGLTLDEIAEQYHVSKHTLRTQLKAVYTKTDCSRQAELVVKILTGPAILNTPAQSDNVRQIVLEDMVPDTQERHNQKMFLADGRALSFAVYGHEEGYPVVLAHGLTGSRFQVHSDEDILSRHGITLYIPERPGFGESDRVHERRITDWPADLEQFLDFLGINEVGLIGYSVGGIFALAAAHALPARIRHLTLISSMGPFRSMSDLDGMLPMFRMVLGLGRYTPSIAMTLMRFASRSFRSNPEQYFERLMESIPEMDRGLFSSSALRQAYSYSLYEAVRQGERDMILEQLLIARDWGFSVEEVMVPVTLWHGELDNNVPCHMARELANRLPTANLQIIPGAGHLLQYRVWDEIIASLSQQLQVQALVMNKNISAAEM